MATTAQNNHSDQATTAAHIAAFADAALPGHDIPWVDALRRAAFDRFEAAGLPHRRIEEWKYTRLSPLARIAFRPRAGADTPLSTIPPSADDGHRLVFVDGQFRDELSDSADLPGGVKLMSLNQALESNPGLEGRISTGSGEGASNSLADLNAAFMTDGAVITLDDGVSLDRPIVLFFMTTGKETARHMRNVVTLGAGARASVIEIYQGQGENFSNTVSDITLGDGAALSHGRIQKESPDTVHHARAGVTLGAGAQYEGLSVALGGLVSRQETDVTFNGENATAGLYGVSLGRDHQHLDHTTRVTHAKPHCRTDELFKSALDGHAHGVFQGKIHIAPGAMGSDAKQQSRALLLSQHAVQDTKPELEIFADDVKCAHGATIGDIDADALFYMTARGIPPAAARSLMIEGFINDVIDRFATRGDDAAAIGRLAGQMIASHQDAEA